MQNQPPYKDVVARVVLHRKKEEEWIALRDQLQHQIAICMGQNAAIKLCEASLNKQIDDLKRKIAIAKGLAPEEKKPEPAPPQPLEIPHKIEPLPIILNKDSLEKKAPNLLEIQPIQLLPEPSPIKTSNPLPQQLPESPPPVTEKKKKLRKGASKKSSGSGSPALYKHSINIHLDAIRALAFYNSMPIIISASDDGTIRLTNCEPSSSKGKKLKNPVNFASLRGHATPVLCLAQYEANSRQYMLSGAVDGTICYWDLPKATVALYDTRGHVCHDRIYEYDFHKDSVWGVSTNGTSAVSVSADGTAKIWNICENPQPEDLPVKSLPVQCRWIEGNRYVVACKNGEILIFNGNKLEKEIKIAHPIESISNIVENIMTVTSGDSFLRVVSLEDGEIIHEIKASQKDLQSCCITSDGECYITTSTAREVRVYSSNPPYDCVFSDVYSREKFGESAICSTVTTGDAKTSYFAIGGADGSLHVFIHNG